MKSTNTEHNYELKSRVKEGKNISTRYECECGWMKVTMIIPSIKGRGGSIRKVYADENGIVRSASSLKCTKNQKKQ